MQIENNLFLSIITVILVAVEIAAPHGKIVPPKEKLCPHVMDVFRRVQFDTKRQLSEGVMPALVINKRSTEEGWSKPSRDDVVEKLFTATFPAFKFPDRERLHVNCGVQFCKDACPKINCNSDEQFLLDSGIRLARLQVFNSLAVTAPQIEIDRIRTNNGDDVTIDEFSPRVRLHSDGIFCMSTSKLALAFCILGIIFLIAVIVSVICLLRTRSKSKEIAFMTTASASLFSSSSSSNSRIESRLLIPYGGTLPYGQVY